MLRSQVHRRRRHGNHGKSDVTDFAAAEAAVDPGCRILRPAGKPLMLPFGHPRRLSTIVGPVGIRLIEIDRVAYLGSIVRRRRLIRFSPRS